GDRAHRQLVEAGPAPGGEAREPAGRHEAAGAHAPAPTARSARSADRPAVAQRARLGAAPAGAAHRGAGAPPAALPEARRPPLPPPERSLRGGPRRGRRLRPRWGCSSPARPDSSVPTSSAVGANAEATT